jgi:hypothetical protein
MFQRYNTSKMLKQSDLATSIESLERNMVAAISAAKKVALPQSVSVPFSTLGMSGAAIDKIARKVITGKRSEDCGSEFLYIFRLSPKNKVPISEIMHRFLAAKATQDDPSYKGEKNLCRANPQHATTTVLYVGRSYSPRERLKQHLRSSTNGTYAIHFEGWANRLEMQLEFHLYKFASVGDRVIQVIEDGLWDHFTPLLGRRGDK